MSRLLLKPLDWQTDDEHVAAVQLSRVALLGAIEVLRRRSARGRESISFAKNDLAAAVHDLNDAVGTDARAVVQRPGQRYAGPLSVRGCEHATVGVDSQSRLEPRQTGGAAQPIRAVSQEHLAGHVASVSRRRTPTNPVWPEV